MSELILAALLLISLPFPAGKLQGLDQRCKFSNLPEDKLVTIEVRVLFGQHGAGLALDGCPKDAETAALLYPGTDITPIVKFQLDNTALERLRPFTRVNGGGVSVACGTLTGQLFAKKGFRLRNIADAPTGNGFGGLGQFRFGFVLQSVGEIRACE